MNIEAQLNAVRLSAYEAGRISAICEFLAQALTSDPDTCLIGEAMEGVSRMVRRLSNDLLTISDPDD